MAMDLSFGNAFFLGDGEFDYYAMPPSERPTSVLQAAVSLSPEQLSEIGKEVFGYDEEMAKYWAESEMRASDIVDKVRETDCCDGAEVPVTVYIDEKRYYSLTIYDEG